MDCNIIKDLIPLYIDGCCSEESAKAVEAHIATCDGCKSLAATMNAPTESAAAPSAPKAFRQICHWKASVLQSVLLFLSFGMITVGVALEAATPAGLLNSYWALNLVIPATGFLLSLANWYFLRSYKSRKSFSTCSCVATLFFILCGYIWAEFHYEMDIFQNFFAWILYSSIGLLLTAALSGLSKLSSNQYARMLGKE